MLGGCCDPGFDRRLTGRRTAMRLSALLNGPGEGLNRNARPFNLDFSTDVLLGQHTPDRLRQLGPLADADRAPRPIPGGFYYGPTDDTFGTCAGRKAHPFYRRPAISRTAPFTKAVLGHWTRPETDFNVRDSGVLPVCSEADTDSDGCRKLVGMRRNDWSACSGTGGRIRRNTHA